MLVGKATERRLNFGCIPAAGFCDYKSVNGRNAAYKEPVYLSPNLAIERRHPIPIYAAAAPLSGLLLSSPLTIAVAMINRRATIQIHVAEKTSTAML